MKQQQRMSGRTKLIRENMRLVRNRREQLPLAALSQLKGLTACHGFSLALGDLLRLENSWYVTHAGLLRLATRRRCFGIRVEQVPDACEPTTRRWVFRATVYKTRDSKGFVGYGDADPSNVSNFVRGAELRVAETRAVNRALRKAYGVALCSVEELGTTSAWSKSFSVDSSGNSHVNEPANGRPRLRDQLCLLIRQYSLDPKLVKAFANDFCGTTTLSEASRDSVESFISLLARSAKQNRDSLVCKLNAYAEKQEVNP